MKTQMRLLYIMKLKNENRINYNCLDLSKSYRLEEFIKDMMSLQNVISYDDIQFK